MWLTWIMLGKLQDSFDDTKQKAATALLRDTIQIRNFAITIAERVSKAFGPTDSSSDVHFVTGFSPWIGRWYFASSLQRHVRGTAISHGR